MSKAILQICMIMPLICLAGAALYNFKYLKIKFRYLLESFKAPYIAWIMLFIGIFLISEKQSQSTRLDYNAIFQIVMITLAGIIVMLTFLFRIVQTIKNVNLAIISIILYGTVGIISGLYSPDYLLSIYKSFLVLIDIFLCMVILSYQPQQYYVRKFINLTYVFYAFLLLSVMIGAIVRPDIAQVIKPSILGFLLGGVVPWMNPNTVSFIAAILVLVTVNHLFDNKYNSIKPLLWSFLICALAVLFFSQSRTSIVGALVSFLLILFFRKKFGLLIICFSFLAVILAGGAFQYAETYLKRGQTEQQLEAMSGRTLLWQEGWKAFKESPVLGYGMASSKYAKFHAAHLHNAFLEVLVTTGFIGFLFWFAALAAVSSKTLLHLARDKIGKDKTLAIDMGVITVCSLIKMTTGYTFVAHDFYIFIYMVLIAYAAFITSSPVVNGADNEKN